MEESKEINFHFSRHTRMFLLILAMLPSAVIASEKLVLGIHPYRPYTELRQMFQPLANYLGQKIGREIEVRIGDSYESHFNAIAQGEIDFAYIGPSQFIKVIQQHKKIPVLARLEVNGKPTFTGKIIVRQRSEFHKLTDLRQCYFAFGSPSSTMSHLVPRQMLYDAGIDVDDLAGYHFYNNHNNVALAVLAGDADAGAVKEAVYDKYKTRGIVAIGTSTEISEHLFVGTTGSDPELIEKVKKILLSLDRKNPATNSVLTPIKHTATALVEATVEDYQKLRRILDALHKRGVKW